MRYLKDPASGCLRFAGEGGAGFEIPEDDALAVLYDTDARNGGHRPSVCCHGPEAAVLARFRSEWGLLSKTARTPEDLAAERSVGRLIGTWGPDAAPGATRRALRAVAADLAMIRFPVSGMRQRDVDEVNACLAATGGAASIAAPPPSMRRAIPAAGSNAGGRQGPLHGGG